MESYLDDLDDPGQDTILSLLAYHSWRWGQQVTLHTPHSEPRHPVVANCTFCELYWIALMMVHNRRKLIAKRKLCSVPLMVIHDVVS